MARTDTLTNFLTDVANSIRSKTGKSEAIDCEDFDTEIESISGGGGDLPNKYVTFTEWNSNGYPTKAKVEGITQIGSYFFIAPNANSVTSKIVNITLPSNTTYLAEACFKYLSNLETINLPNGITEIGKEAFYGCTKLDVQIPSTVEVLGQSAFQDCSSLTASQLPSTLKRINTSTFSGCSNVTFSSLPEGTITYFSASNTFQNCSKITISKYPNNLTSVMNASNTFNGCSSIPKFDYANVTNMGNLNFGYCTSMVSFIGEKVTNIPNNNNNYGAFKNCTGLKAVWIGNAITSANFGSNAFNGCSSLKRIYIDLPRATVEAFSYYSTKWSNNTVDANCQVICNDDNNFVSASDFRNTDWSLI